MTDNFKIKTVNFEGPFGLLLDLVEKRKLLINEISLAQVTEDYLQHMNKLGGLSPMEISGFILVASTLILIKSKSLLPDLNLTDEEEGDIKNLEERLRLYKIFIELSGQVKNNFGKKIIFAPLERKNSVVVFLPDDRITKESMMTFAQNALGAMPKNVFLPKVEVRTVISIEEMIDRLTDRIKNSLKMSFRDFSGRPATREEKVTAIVGFLAMLELVRQGMIEARQENHGEDILITMTSEELIITNDE